jgi:rRNA maturation endonuclease Nob1
MVNTDVSWPVILAVLTVFALLGLGGLMFRRSAAGTWGRLCAGCGTYVPNFAKFCSHCGRSVEQQK